MVPAEMGLTFCNHSGTFTQHALTLTIGRQRQTGRPGSPHTIFSFLSCLLAHCERHTPFLYPLIPCLQDDCQSTVLKIQWLNSLAVISASHSYLHLSVFPRAVWERCCMAISLPISRPFALVEYRLSQCAECGTTYRYSRQATILPNNCKGDLLAILMLTLICSRVR